MRYCALLLLLLGACAVEPVRKPDYDRPFEIVTTSYMVPVAIGIAAPGTVGGWDEGVSFKRWIKGWTHRPVPKDRDAFVVNYILHPLSGSETHIMARDHGWSFWEAAAFDMFGSIYWEYCFENLFEPPSRTDLLTTGPLGMIIGELRYQAKRAGILPWLMDPFGDFYEK